MEKTCKHPDGCDRPVWKCGWCSMHYNRLRTTGDVGPAAKLTNWGELKGAKCSVEGCPRQPRARRLCSFHYNRVRFKGEPGGVESLRREMPDGSRTWTPGQRHRFYKYGLTPAAFDAMLARQGGRCYVCRTDTPTEKGWSVDHCHESNAVRFIACNPCNAALGLIKEDPQIARRLLEVAIECQQMRLRIA